MLQAYAMLENRGLIEARPQSGYYVRASQRAIDEPGTTRDYLVQRLELDSVAIDMVWSPMP